MKVTVKVEGLRELDEALGQLKKATARAVLHRVLRKAAQPMYDKAQQLVPDDPSTYLRDLKRSLAISTKIKNTVGNAEYDLEMRSFGTKAEAVQAMRDARRAARGKNGNSFAEVHVGTQSWMRYAHFVEFGTVHNAPQPFLRPAWDQHKEQALQIVEQELGSEIEKAAARAARRAARRAAKGK